MRDETAPTSDRTLSRRIIDRDPRAGVYDNRQIEQRALVRRSRDDRSRQLEGQYSHTPSNSPPSQGRGPYVERGLDQLALRPNGSERMVERIITCSRDYRGKARPEIAPEDIKSSLITLYGNVRKAISFLYSFKHEYEQDILRVKPYAEAAELAYLWVEKVDYNNELGSPAEIQIAQGKMINDQSPRFKDISSQLKASMSVATRNSSLGTSSQHVAVAKKLSAVCVEIPDLLRNAFDSIKGVDPLLTELEMLAILLERNGAGEVEPKELTSDTVGEDQIQQSITAGDEISVAAQATSSPFSNLESEPGENHKTSAGERNQELKLLTGSRTDRGDARPV